MNEVLKYAKQTGVIQITWRECMHVPLARSFLE